MVLTLKAYKPLSRVSDITPGGINHPAGKGEIRFACRVLTRYGQVVIDFDDFSDLISYNDSLGIEGGSGSFTIRMKANLCNEELLKRIHPGYVIEAYAARNENPLVGVVTDPSKIRRIDTTPDLSVIPSAAPVAVEGASGVSSGTGSLSTTQATDLTPERRAFLDVITYAEGTSGANGYTTQFTGRQFSGFTDHLRQAIRSGRYTSSAAGRYQILSSTWDEVRQQQGLTDFSPANQDRAAIALIRRRGALADLDAGNFDRALQLCRREWASLPGAGYG